MARRTAPTVLIRPLPGTGTPTYLVTHQGVRYWVAPAGGPADHVAWRQVCRLAQALTPARSRTPQPRKVR